MNERYETAPANPPRGGSSVQPGPQERLLMEQRHEVRARTEMWTSFKLLAEAALPIIQKIQRDFEARPPD